MCKPARIRSGVRLERRVAASLVSQRHPQRLADGLYPTTCVATLLHKHQRCLTYTTTTAWSTKRVLRRDRSMIMKLRMLYILHNKKLGCSRHRQMGHCRTLPQKILRLQKLNSLSSKLVLWDRLSLKDSWNGGCCLQTEKKKNGNGKEGRRKTSLTLFPRIIRLHLPTFMKLKVCN